MLRRPPRRLRIHRPRPAAIRIARKERPARGRGVRRGQRDIIRHVDAVRARACARAVEEGERVFGFLGTEFPQTGDLGVELSLAIGEQLRGVGEAVDEARVEDGVEQVGSGVQGDEARGFGEVVGFAEEAGGGLGRGEVVGVDGGGGGVVFGFDERVGEGTG